MLAIERKRHILELVNRDRRVLVGDLSRTLGVTEETIRRDLHKLEREGSLNRTHGGAVAREGEIEDLPFKTRQTTNIQAKKVIARLAVRRVRSGDALMLDSSSTVYETLSQLESFADLTIITNSVRIIAEPNATRHHIMSVGGELRRRSMTFVGPLANQAIRQFNADLAFISCKALSLTGGIMDASVPDAEVKGAFIQAARHVCLLVDADKFDQTALITVSALSVIDTIITDREPSEAWRDLLAREAVELIHP
jgi:DeoR/GlpR family transcriptional regulator of sugar metabolism